MLKKLLYRWINPELQRQNEALIWQIDKLVAEKQMLINEVSHEKELNEAYLKYLTSTRSFDTDE